MCDTIACGISRSTPTGTSIAWCLVQWYAGTSQETLLRPQPVGLIVSLERCGSLWLVQSLSCQVRDGITKCGQEFPTRCGGGAAEGCDVDDGRGAEHDLVSCTSPRRWRVNAQRGVPRPPRPLCWARESRRSTRERPRGIWDQWDPLPDPSSGRIRCSRQRRPWWASQNPRNRQTGGRELRSTVISLLNETFHLNFHVFPRSADV